MPKVISHLVILSPLSCAGVLHPLGCGPAAVGGHAPRILQAAAGGPRGAGGGLPGHPAQGTSRRAGGDRCGSLGMTPGGSQRQALPSATACRLQGILCQLRAAALAAIDAELAD